MYISCLKRAIDIILSAAGLAILAIPMLAIAAVVKIDSRGPVLFWQKRSGIHKATFMMPKFRTMYIETPANMPTHMLSDPDRWITPCGKFLRRTSLDELPQLFNVLAGDMSFIGPRPLIPEESHIRELRREYGVYSVRPGLTGWAQVNGRDCLSDEEKAAYDREYIERRSLLFDTKIFFRTIWVVLTGKDVVEGGMNHKEEK